MPHEAWLEMADDYSLGGLGKKQQGAFEAHAVSCPECSARTLENRQALTSWSLQSLSDAAPAAGLRQRVLSAIDAQAVPLRAFSPLRRWGWGLAGALAVSACVLWFYRPEAEPAMNMAHHEMFMGPNTTDIRLTGIDGKGNATLKWNGKTCQGCLMVKGFTLSPEGRHYVLWAVNEKGETVPIGAFQVDSSGRSHADFLEPAAVDRYREFRITLEAQDASPPLSPSGIPIAAGKI